MCFVRQSKKLHSGWIRRDSMFNLDLVFQNSADTLKMGFRKPCLGDVKLLTTIVMLIVVIVGPEIFLMLFKMKYKEMAICNLRD